MRNVYILDEFITSAKNGIGTYLKAYLKCLKAVDANICLIVFNADCDEFSISYKNGVKYMNFPCFAWGDFPTHAKIVHKFFRLYIEDSPENVFCFNHSPCDELLAIVRQSHPLSKLVFTIHDQLWTGTFKGDEKKFRNAVLHLRQPEVAKRYPLLDRNLGMEQRMYETVDAVIALSPGTRKILLEVYGVKQKEKVWLIPNGLSDKLPKDNAGREELRKQFSIDKNDFIILFVGRVTELKGGAALCESFKYVLEKFPRTRLIIAGPVLKQFSEYASGKGFSKIVYTGLLKPEELRKWYQMADIGVIPSYTEQCSYVGIEMMMHGLPIVASDGFGVRDMFKDGENAIVAPIGRRTGKAKTFSENLAQALISMLSSAELREKMGRNAREVYLKCYSLAKMKDGYKRLFDALE